MAALLLYVVTAVAVFILWNRYVHPLSRGAALVLFLLPLCVTGRALLTGNVYGPADLAFMAEPLKAEAAKYRIHGVHNGLLSDLYAQIWPWQSAVRDAWSQHSWPLLNPFMLCGDILAAAAQPAAFDPFNLLALLLPLSQWMTFYASLTLLFAALFTFGYARTIGCGEPAALVAAAGYMCAANMLVFVGWPLSRAWAYLPLVLLGVRLVVRERRLRGAALLTIALTLLILSGHPESLLHVVLTGCVYGVFEIAITRSEVPKAVGLAVASGVLALLLGMIQLLPFLEASAQSFEADLRRGVFANTEFSPMPGLVKKRVASMFLPYYGGQPWRQAMTGEYDSESARAGSVLAVLSFVALLVAWRRRETWFFFALAVFCAWGAADALPVARWLHAAPLLKFALNQRLAYAATFAMAILAAIAIDAWPQGRRRFTAVAVCVAAVVGLGFAARALWPHELSIGVPAPLMKLLLAVEVVPLVIAAIVFAWGADVSSAGPRDSAAVAARGRTGRPLPFRAALVLALVLGQRLIADGTVYPVLPRAAFYPEVPLFHALPKSDEPYRVTAAHFAMIPNMSAFYRLEDPRGYEAMTFIRLRETYPFWSSPQPVSFNAIGELGKPFLAFLNIRYLLMPPDVKALDPPWKFVTADATGALFENTDALLRAFVPPRIHYDQNGPQSIGDMYRADNFADDAFIEVAEYNPYVRPNGPGVVHTREVPNGLRIDATMSRDAWVVISQTAWKGWRAYVDGRRVQWRFANHAFIGVWVPAGHHELSLVYLPESFVRGRAISFATLGLLGIGLVVKAFLSSRAAGVAHSTRFARSGQAARRRTVEGSGS
ncbi:MAG TPA: YfhO family protein [Thermoanaerobaculia bacterium]